ncbi:NAD(P)-binding protein [Pedobacter sp. HMF7647]|uniref:Tryptophan 2-monooxygenase n=1 Tax=Hufsiella arboris TaxID=2695275 RepID=A0A7K1YEH4_9SPHI|nr:NAD(P)/FAD-dependent oxidoreductase [Hufsiella arboris]MXV52429.1 NAD(P)-binding protein [Hufsiella arboris]
MNNTVLVIGAGVSGLYAAALLAEKGYAVTILEASNRIGGRIRTYIDQDFKDAVELGAEFVHGNLPVTLSLLNEAGIGYRKMVFKGVSSENGLLKKGGGFIKDWHLFEEKLENLDLDITVNDFLEQEFSAEQFNDLRQSVKRYASGFDTADTSDASMLSLKNEWLHEEEEQYRVDGGYIRLLSFLEEKLEKHGVRLLLNQKVVWIKTENYGARVATSTGEFWAGKAILTVSIGVLKSGAIKFPDTASLHQEAIQQMGFGAIIKVLLKFKQPFWETVQGGIAKDAGFIFSSEVIPTWWTQAPERSNVLTGWLGGPPADKLKDDSDKEILIKSIQSLSAIFSIPVNEIESGLIAWKVANWTADPFILGSYSYPTVGNDGYIDVLSEPVEEKIYFSGEALYKGQATGTVEAALSSAKDTVDRIIRYNS